MQTIHGTQTSLHRADPTRHTRDGYATERCGAVRTGDTAGHAPTRIRPARRRSRGSNGTKVRARLRSSRGPNRRAERIDYRTYRLSNVSVGLPRRQPNVYPFGRAPVRPGRARCPACPRVARKRHARQTRDEVEDVRPCGCPARHTGPHDGPGKLTVPSDAFEPWPRQLDRKLDSNSTVTRQDSSTATRQTSTDLDRPRQTST